MSQVMMMKLLTLKRSEKQSEREESSANKEPTLIAKGKHVFIKVSFQHQCDSFQEVATLYTPSTFRENCESCEKTSSISAD